MAQRSGKRSHELKVSIVVPVYNVSDYIERCVSSIMRQTYENIECIFVDDCTPDDSMQKIQEILRDYKGSIEFKLLKHERNRGLSAGRNTGTQAATGDLIYYLDSDDEIYEDSIETLVSDFEANPDADLIQGNTQRIPNEEVVYDYNINHANLPESYECNHDYRARYYDRSKYFPVNAWNKLLPMKFIRENDLYFLEGVIHEDEHWMFNVVQKAKKVIFEKKMTYIHYINENSIMTSSSRIKRAKNMCEIYCDNLKHLDYDYNIQYYILLSGYLNYVMPISEITKNEKFYNAFIESGKAHKLHVASTLLMLLWKFRNTDYPYKIVKKILWKFINKRRIRLLEQY